MCGEIVEVLRSDEVLSLEWIVNISRIFIVNSPRFHFYDGVWFMSIWPSPTEWMSFDLHSNYHSLITLKVTVGIRGPRGVEMRGEMERNFRRIGSWTKSEFCLKNDPKSFLRPNDALIITLEMKITSSAKDQPVNKDEVKVLTEEILSTEQEAMEELQSSLQNLLKNAENSDVVIKVQGKEFRAHRLILQARSPVFQAMFTHDMLEKQRNMVTLEDCDPETFSCFLEHVYTGSIGMISAGNVTSLFSAAEKYDFKSLKKECIQFMKKNVTVACFCDIITLAVKHNERELIDCATEFFCCNSLVIVKTAEWQSFLAENPTVGNELFIKVLSKQENIFCATN